MTICYSINNIAHKKLVSLIFPFQLLLKGHLQLLKNFSSVISGVSSTSLSIDDNLTNTFNIFQNPNRGINTFQTNEYNNNLIIINILGDYL